jgi:hypothetical protein
MHFTHKSEGYEGYLSKLVLEGVDLREMEWREEWNRSGRKRDFDRCFINAAYLVNDTKLNVGDIKLNVKSIKLNVLKDGLTGACEQKCVTLWWKS